MNLFGNHKLIKNVLEKENVKLSVKGRHDPCILPRAVPCVEAATAIAIFDLLCEDI